LKHASRRRITATVGIMLLSAAFGGAAAGQEPFTGWRLRAGALVCPSALVAAEARTSLALRDQDRFAETGCFLAPRILEILPVEAPGWRAEHEFQIRGHLWRAHIYPRGSDGPAGSDAYFDERDAEGFARAGPFPDSAAAEGAFDHAQNWRAGLGHAVSGPPGGVELIVGPSSPPALAQFCRRFAELHRPARRKAPAEPVVCELPPLPPQAQ
jgi:hypothetical protein